MNEGPASIGDDELHAYADGLLSGERRLVVERALRQDPALAAKVADYAALNTLLHDRYDRVLAEPVPRRFRAAELGEAANLRRFASLAAALVLGIGIGAALQGGTRAPGLLAERRSPTSIIEADAPERFAQQAAIAHVVYMPDIVRPADVGADRERDFVQWLSNRLGTAVHAPVLTASGFELVGGRLFPDRNGGVAEFMYRDAMGQRVTLYIARRKVNAKRTAFRLYQDGPVNVFYWMDGDFGYAVTGGIDRKPLLALSHDVHAQLSASKQD